MVPRFSHVIPEREDKFSSGNEFCKSIPAEFPDRTSTRQVGECISHADDELRPQASIIRERENVGSEDRDREIATIAGKLPEQCP